MPNEEDLLVMNETSLLFSGHHQDTHTSTMESFSAEDVVGYNPSSPVVKLQYRGAVYDNSIRVLPTTTTKDLYHAAKGLANIPESTRVSLLRIDHQGDLVTDPRVLRDGELLEIIEGSTDDRKEQKTSRR
jgi:hypothetical protein